MEAITTKLVFVSSPLRGNREQNALNARMYCRWVLSEFGFVPIAPHLFLPRFLDETNREEDERGLVAGFELLRRSDEMWVFSKDYASASEGMKAEIKLCKNIGKPYRFVDPNDVPSIALPEDPAKTNG